MSFESYSPSSPLLAFWTHDGPGFSFLVWLSWLVIIPPVLALLEWASLPRGAAGSFFPVLSKARGWCWFGLVTALLAIGAIAPDLQEIGCLQDARRFFLAVSPAWSVIAVHGALAAICTVIIRLGAPAVVPFSGYWVGVALISVIAGTLFHTLPLLYLPPLLGLGLLLTVVAALHARSVVPKECRPPFLSLRLSPFGRVIFPACLGLVLCWSAAEATRRWQEARAVAYVARLIPLLMQERAATGLYPMELTPEHTALRPWGIASLPLSYTSYGQTYHFVFSPPAQAKLELRLDSDRPQWYCYGAYWW